MKTDRRVLASALLAFLIPLFPAHVSAADSPATPDACSLLSTDELSAILDTRVRRARPQTAEKGTSCSFALSAETLQLSLWPTSPEDFDAFRQMLVESGIELESASGVGDSAYYWDHRLYVRVAAQGITIQLGDSVAPDPERSRKLQAIARAAIAKLP